MPCWALYRHSSGQHPLAQRALTCPHRPVARRSSQGVEGSLRTSGQAAAPRGTWHPQWWCFRSLLFSWSVPLPASLWPAPPVTTAAVCPAQPQPAFSLPGCPRPCPLPDGLSLVQPTVAGQLPWWALRPHWHVMSWLTQSGPVTVGPHFTKEDPLERGVC